MKRTTLTAADRANIHREQDLHDKLERAASFETVDLDVLPRHHPYEPYTSATSYQPRTLTATTATGPHSQVTYPHLPSGTLVPDQYHSQSTGEIDSEDRLDGSSSCTSTSYDDEDGDDDEWVTTSDDSEGDSHDSDYNSEEYSTSVTGSTEDSGESGSSDEENVIVDKDDTVSKKSGSTKITVESRAYRKPEVDKKIAIRALNEPTTFFKDGKRCIDYILVYDNKSGSGKRNTKMEKLRKMFEDKLQLQGLDLEYEKSTDGHKMFVKIHATWAFLACAAEFTNCKMPIKEYDINKKRHRIREALQSCIKCTRSSVWTLFSFPKEAEKPPIDRYFSMKFERDLQDYFLINDKRDFFSTIQRLRLVAFAIQRVTVDLAGKGKKHLTLPDMIRSGVYLAEYCLHDSDATDSNFKYVAKDPEDIPMRLWLRKYWASFRAWRYPQPLDEIWSYLGEKSALYFAWLARYTRFLLPASIAGFIVIIAGIVQVYYDLSVAETCDSKPSLDICPLCDPKECPFTKLDKYCFYAHVGVLMDSFLTPVFAFLISVWGVVFLNTWKREEATLATRWNGKTDDTRGELIRPEFKAQQNRTRINPVTKQEEQYMLAQEKTLRLTFSTLVLICVYGSLMVLFYGINYYKIQINSHLNSNYSGNSVVRYLGSDMIASICASLVNLFMIFVLSALFSRLAWWLTYFECPRTEDQFEESYIYKRTLFEFVNNYGMLLYLALLKGKLFTTPDKQNSPLVEQCSPIGCMTEVTLQLIIILVGKQTVDNVFQEIAWPQLKLWVREKFSSRKKNEEEADVPRWEKDYLLEPLDSPIGVDDFLEMVIQFGFITMFAAAFPLAPFFALMNNIIEIRIDASTYITESRRVIPRQCASIGSWIGILEAFTKVAVMTNAVVIAFTSRFLEKCVYMSIAKYAELMQLTEGSISAQFNSNSTLKGFRRWSLTPFATKYYQAGLSEEEVLESEFGEVGSVALPDMPDVCYFSGYYVDEAHFHDTTNTTFSSHNSNITFGNLTTDYNGYTPGDTPRYFPRSEWWILMAFRLVFIIAFEHLIITIQSLISAVSSGVPDSVRLFEDREKYLSRQILARPPPNAEENDDKTSQPETENTIAGNKEPGDDSKPESKRSSRRKKRRRQNIPDGDIFEAFVDNDELFTDDDDDSADKKQAAKSWTGFITNRFGGGGKEKMDDAGKKSQPVAKKAPSQNLGPNLYARGIRNTAFNRDW